MFTAADRRTASNSGALGSVTGVANANVKIDIGFTFLFGGVA
ncbi:hypothetical protein Cha6605_1403 [Chamaesiphon minutus PCC 6605]|uniref:Uncharacterized protein n=1 Tax=Chamaesiphon minutus (strain ATCC 27169 / PCC 6605) TaxID=1173020 RepID=K9UCL8_CHAP6|nr:hypothetical protein Cha6605_1403 [Chamaesiphon minutus PCC 6605]